jgi:hypothetical protein
MRRREFIILIGGTVTVWSVSSRAQQPPKSIIGFLGSESPDAWAGRLQELHRGLSELGFIGDKIFPSNIAGLKVETSACRQWQPI